jgi:hypothetical protein
MAGLATPITEVPIITPHGGDRQDIVTVTDMVITKVTAVPTTRVTIMDMATESIPAAVQGTGPDTTTVNTIILTAIMFIRAGQRG